MYCTSTCAQRSLVGLWSEDTSLIGTWRLLSIGFIRPNFICRTSAPSGCPPMALYWWSFPQWTQSNKAGPVFGTAPWCPCCPNRQRQQGNLVTSLGDPSGIPLRHPCTLHIKASSNVLPLLWFYLKYICVPWEEINFVRADRYNMERRKISFHYII